MAKRFVLRDLEAKHGDLHKVIPQLVNRYGQLETALRLGTTQATISGWLKSNGYVFKGEWTRTETTSEESIPLH
jgi:hypothetical protein